MNYKFRFLLLLAIILWITSSSAENPAACDHDILPAVHNMIMSVDITKFNALILKDHFRSYVLNLSCESQQRTWSNARHLPNVTFSLPDQVAQITLNESNHLHSLQVHWAYDMIDLQSILLPISGSPKADNRLIGACARNGHYNAYIRNYYRENASFALVTSQITVYNIQFKPPSELILDSEFVNAVTNLPDKYEHDPAEYDKFVKGYGTHYIEGANFGAKNYWLTPIPNHYIASQKEIEECLKAQYLLTFGRGASWESVRKPKNFDKIIDELYCCNFEGGHIAEDDLDDLYRIPGYIEYSFRPLEDLFVDEKLKAKMKRASEMYRIGAYLGELMAVYDAATEYYQPSSEDRLLLSKVKAFVNSNISSINAEQTIQIINDLYSKVKERPHLDQLISDYYVTAALKLQFAQSICDRSAGLCPSNAIVAEYGELEKLYQEYESSKVDGTIRFTRELYHQFGRRVHELNSRYRIRDDLYGTVGASCEKCVLNQI